MDFIERPLDIITTITESCSTPSKWRPKLKEYFEERLTNGSVLYSIPSLNDYPLHRIRNKSLVRFRGMIQDMFDPEFFMEAFEVNMCNTNSRKLVSGLYQEVFSQPDTEAILESPQNVIQDRQVYYCIPTPAENSWVKEEYSKQSLCQEEMLLPDCSASSTLNKKRHLGDDETMMDVVAVDSLPSSEDGESNSKRLKCTSTNTGQENVQSAVEMCDLSIPVPDLNCMGYIIKVYDTCETFALNDVVEVVGILFTENETVDLQTEEQGIEPLSDLTSCPPFEVKKGSLLTSEIPRLHVIQSFRLKHMNPLLPTDVLLESQSTRNLLNGCIEIRSHLRLMLERLLFGDSLAADYVLCHLLSFVYLRQDIAALGNFSVNLTNVKKEDNFPRYFYKIIEMLTTKSYFLPLTISNLNDAEYTPFKDYSKNCMEAGLLQLSKNTHLIIDETCFSPGKLEAKGVKNVMALRNIILSQKLDYDFQYHQLEFLTDIPVIIVSEGKSLLSADCVVPIQKVGNFDIAKSYQSILNDLTPSILENIRRYLCLLKMIDYHIPEELQVVVQNDFVEQRQVDSNTMKTSDLHNLLVISRLLSLSYGQATLQLSTWERAKDMEEQRKARLRK